MKLPVRCWNGQWTQLTFLSGVWLTPKGRAVRPVLGTWASPMCVVAVFWRGFYFSFRPVKDRAHRRWAYALRTAEK